MPDPMPQPSINGAPLLEALARLAGVGVVVLDADGRPTFASPAALESFNRPSVEELAADGKFAEERFPALALERQRLDDGQTLLLVSNPELPSPGELDQLLARRTRVTAEIERLVAHDLRAPLNAIQLG